jgi:hypothetical protein
MLPGVRRSPVDFCRREEKGEVSRLDPFPGFLSRSLAVGVFLLPSVSLSNSIKRFAI